MCLGFATFGGLEMWTAPLAGKVAVVLFNRSPAPEEMTVEWADIGLEVTQKCTVRDVWAATDRGTASGKYSNTAQRSRHT
jgi:hypothetical protein